MNYLSNDDRPAAGGNFASRLQRIVQHGIAGSPCDSCGQKITSESVTINRRTPVIFVVEIHCSACGHHTAEWVIRNEAVDTVIDAIEIHRAKPVNENYEPEFLTTTPLSELSLAERAPVNVDEFDDYPNPLQDHRLGSESAISILRFKILWERVARLGELWS